LEETQLVEECVLEETQAELLAESVFLAESMLLAASVLLAAAGLEWLADANATADMSHRRTYLPHALP
jgi:hypothetical protein